jgi:hypothetical protein
VARSVDGHQSAWEAVGLRFAVELLELVPAQPERDQPDEPTDLTDLVIGQLRRAYIETIEVTGVHVEAR